MTIIKSISLMSFFTLLSRVLGYVRDLIFAFTLGATSNADNFLLAFRLPSLFRRLFAEGAINNVFIPIYLDIKKKFNEKTSYLFASQVFSYLLIILISTTILCEIFITNIVSFLAPGFSQEQIDRTSFLASIMFPYLVFISTSSFFGALLNANNRYALWSFSPIILNLFMIGAMGLSYYYSLITSLILSWSVLISGLLQILIIIFWASRKKIKLSLVKPKLTKNIKSLFKLLLPNILAGGIIQINQFIGVMFASSITGAISWLYYADRIAQLPLGVFVISISTILLTLLSKYEANKNKLKIKTQIDSSCVLMFVLTTISMVGLFAISDLIVDILFKRGKFGLGDVIATSDAIVMYAIGLPAFGFIKIFSVIFFAKQNTLTPFKVSSISMIINLILIFLLVNKLGHLGIALSLSLSSWINAALLYFFLWKKNYWRFDKVLIIKIFKIIICSFITYTVLSIFYMLVLYTDYLTLNEFIAKVLLLSFLIFFSATLFFSLLRIMGIISFDKNKIKTFLKGERK